MKPQCIQAVEAHLSQIAGKAVKLSDAAIRRIDSRMHEGAKVLARQDRAAWQSMGPDDRTIAIGNWVRDQERLQADATARSQIRQLAATTDAARRMNDFAAARKDKPGKWGNALIDLLEGVDNTLRGAEQVAVRGLGDMLEKAKVGGFNLDFGSKNSDAFFSDVVREIYGNDTGNGSAKAFAKQWSDTMDGYRQARNRAGGTVGKLDHYAPQSHDPTIMQRAGGEEKWTSFMMKNLDRDHYLDDAGNRLSDDDLREVIGEMYKSITQDGINKITLDPLGLAEDARPAFGSANIARSLNASHREIHLKDADSVIAYNKQFSSKSLGSSFFSHINRAARDNALVSELGPNPGQTFATLNSTALRRDSIIPGAKFDNGAVAGSGRGGFNAEAYFRQMVKNNIDFTTVDRVSSAITAYQAATKLTSTALRAPFQDTPGIFLNMADVGQLGNVGSILRTAFSPKEAKRFGIAAEVATQAAREGSERIMSQGRFNIANAMSRYAQATMKYTLLDAWTSAARRAGQTSHAFALGDWSKHSWSSLDSSQRALLNNAGIVESDWQHIMNVPRQQLRGNDIHDISDVSSLGLSEDETSRIQSRMMGFIRMGGDIVTSEHNLTAQTIMSAGGRTNALTKQVMLFKNAGAIQTAHMLDRLGRKSGTSRVGYVAATAAMSLGFGYMALVAQALSNGQNPPPLDDWRTIGRAMSVAGGFAMVQDLIVSMYDTASGDNSGHSSSAVPIFGDMGTLAKIAFAAPKDPSKAGYMAIKFARQQIAPLNYWYTKAAVDHLFFNDAAEAMNPGYQQRLRKYAGQQGQQYFYDPSGNLHAPGIGQYAKPF